MTRQGQRHSMNEKINGVEVQALTRSDAGGNGRYKNKPARPAQAEAPKSEISNLKSASEPAPTPAPPPELWKLLHVRHRIYDGARSAISPASAKVILDQCAFAEQRRLDPANRPVGGNA